MSRFLGHLTCGANVARKESRLNGDAYFVHRTRVLEGKDGNPMDEVRVLCTSMLTNGGRLLADRQVKMDPAKSVLGLKVGDEIVLTEAGFVRLSAAYFEAIGRVFV